jgi:chromosome segregation protein
VREHFAVIFRKLFGGGKADILLENPELPLECGIDIKARPPGKELRSITLLSGGERSLTAVALLFAIFKAHPCPCAFMDEVDAALDEDNTERFVRLVEESRDDAQFIVVTHSKRTMEHAGLLYGVTMPERGVSRRVAVRLEQMDEEGRIRDLEALNREAARQAAAETVAAERPAPAPRPALPPEVEESSEESSMPAEEPVMGVLEAPAFARRAKAETARKPPPSSEQEAGAGS